MESGLYVTYQQIHQPILELPLVESVVVHDFRVDHIVIPTKYDTLQYPILVFVAQDESYFALDLIYSDSVNSHSVSIYGLIADYFYPAVNDPRPIIILSSKILCFNT